MDRGTLVDSPAFELRDREKFNLREDDRLWLQKIMSQTPQEAGTSQAILTKLK